MAERKSRRLRCRPTGSVSRDESCEINAEKWTLIHDFAFSHGGAELVTEVLANDVLPSSKLVVLAGDRSVVSSLVNGDDSRVRILLPWLNARWYRYALPIFPVVVLLMPRIEGSILCSSYAFALGMRATRNKYVYSHSPLRQAWSGRSRYATEGALSERLAVRIFGAPLRALDRFFARDAAQIFATSTAVRERVLSAYKREAQIVPPPLWQEDEVPIVDHDKRCQQLLWVGRIVDTYKKLSTVVEAMSRLPEYKLLVVGDGRDRERIERGAPSNVEFLGWLDRDRLIDLYGNSRFLVFPSEDDFGIVPIEAMRLGTPVLAYGRGGALDTVIPSLSGLFFDEQTPASIADAVRIAEKSSWDSSEIANVTKVRFSRARFASDMEAAMSNRGKVI